MLERALSTSGIHRSREALRKAIGERAADETRPARPASCTQRMQAGARETRVDAVETSLRAGVGNTPGLTGTERHFYRRLRVRRSVGVRQTFVAVVAAASRVTAAAFGAHQMDRRTRDG